VALVRTDVSEEPGASFIRVTKIGALGEPHGVTTQKTPFFWMCFRPQVKGEDAYWTSLIKVSSF
jgi:hypothetical protein